MSHRVAFPWADTGAVTAAFDSVPTPGGACSRPWGSGNAVLCSQVSVDLEAFLSGGLSFLFPGYMAVVQRRPLLSWGGNRTLCTEVPPGPSAGVLGSPGCESWQQGGARAL